ncbi:redoxin domain-containing protein [Bacillus rubiinfantis]|uniref:redoxin domain-containing protein n=1 Tax=Bacillus rubiinfantis TaxID=1499680 RepID=UPI000A8DD05E|nr:redoxin domain-containing protein [Bacillus rubiinfantis]
MTVFQIGSISIMAKWLLLGLAVLIGLLVIQLWLRKTYADIQKKLLELLINSLILGFIILKGSLIIFEPTIVINSPLSLLYFTGGTPGLVFAIVISSFYFLFKARKVTIAQAVILKTGAVFFITVFSLYHGLAFLFLESNHKLHLQLSLAAFSVGLILFLLQKMSLSLDKDSVKRESVMIKNSLIIIVFVGLISWVIYGQISSPSEKEKSTSTPSASSQKSNQKSVEIGVEEGKKAPNFQLRTLGGKAVQLSDYQGKVVILNLWASWCPPCKAEMPHMQKFYQEHKNNNVEILAVNLTTAEKNSDGIRPFVKKYGLTFPILLDEQGEIGNTYQAFTIPTSYFIDKNGIIFKKIVGPMDQEMMTELFQSLEKSSE